MKNKPIIIPILLVAACFLSGVFIFILGVKGSISLNNKTKNYETTVGYLSDYGVYSDSEVKNGKVKNATYYLVYTYEVDGQSYTVSTDYGQGKVPEYGTTKEIKYNPDSPDKAVVTGVNGNRFMIFFGLFFMLGSSVFIWIGLYVFDIVKFNAKAFELFIGGIFVLFGYGFLYMMGDSFNPKSAFELYGVPAVIPVILMLAGGLQIVKTIIGKKE